MNVNLKLIILHIDLQTMSSGCLLEDENIISHKIEESNIANELRSILVEYLEIQPEWVKFNLIDVLSDENGLSIIYGCIIPSIIKNKKGKWIKLGDINDKNTKKLVFQASQKT